MIINYAPILYDNKYEKIIMITYIYIYIYIGEGSIEKEYQYKKGEKDLEPLILGRSNSWNKIEMNHFLWEKIVCNQIFSLSSISNILSLQTLSSSKKSIKKSWDYQCIQDICTIFSTNSKLVVQSRKFSQITVKKLHLLSKFNQFKKLKSSLLTIT